MACQKLTSSPFASFGLQFGLCDLQMYLLQNHPLKAVN